MSDDPFIDLADRLSAIDPVVVFRAVAHDVAHETRTHVAMQVGAVGGALAVAVSDHEVALGFDGVSASEATALFDHEYGTASLPGKGTLTKSAGDMAVLSSGRLAQALGSRVVG